jgi:hypothetical protein
MGSIFGRIWGARSHLELTEDIYSAGVKKYITLLKSY